METHYKELEEDGMDGSWG
jgi:hypothetical protein